MKYDLPNAERDRYLAEERLIFESTELVAEKMAEVGMTGRDLAKALGVSPGEISQRMSGTRNLTLRSLASMLHALGVEAEVRERSLAKPSEQNGEARATGSATIPDLAVGTATVIPFRGTFATVGTRRAEAQAV
ncbi:MAG: helix-turn-helix transcriptional regulator [Frankiales bacterium]|jgi:hypothetical protein|nr:helix-turn-helix transcriptional regulator [Frankiales bacterium]